MRLGAYGILICCLIAVLYYPVPWPWNFALALVAVASVLQLASAKTDRKGDW